MAHSISPQQTASLLEQGAFFLDVRTPGEFAAGHIPGAVNVPLDQLAQAEGSLPQEGVLVVYCGSGQRSASAVEFLEGKVQCELANLTGGYSAWSEQEFPCDVEIDSAAWSLERQTLFCAGSLALAGLVFGKAVPSLRSLSWIVSGGLVYAGVSGNCYLKQMLAKAPWNQDPQAWNKQVSTWKQGASKLGQQAKEGAAKAKEKAVQLGGVAEEKVKEASKLAKAKVENMTAAKTGE